MGIGGSIVKAVIVKLGKKIWIRCGESNDDPIWAA
jgi:hypothetical protein